MQPTSSRLEGKVALITGSGRGMGRAHAELLATNGADVVVHDISETGAEETAELVRRGAPSWPWRMSPTYRP